MENLSIKILDALFDLCEGESYVILDQEDITASFPEHSFETDELTEILESLTVEGFIDLKYADNTSYCVAMRTKGRTLIKQSREKLQHILHENAEHPEDALIEGETSDVAELPDVADPVASSIPAPEPTRRRRSVSAPSVEEVSLPDGHFSDSDKLSRGYNTRESDEEAEKNQKRRERRAFLASLAGAAIGSLVMDLIFLVIILLKLRG